MEKLFELIELEIYLKRSCCYNRIFSPFFYPNNKTDTKPIDLNWTRFPWKLGHRDDFNREREEENGGETRLFPRSSRPDRYDVYYYNYALAHYIAKRTKRRYAGLELAPLSHRSPTSESFTRLCALHTTRACYCRLSSFSAKRSEKKNLTYTYTYIVYYIYIHIYSKSKDKDNQNNEKS